MWSVFSKGRRIFYSLNRYLIDWGLEMILESKNSLGTLPKTFEFK